MNKLPNCIEILEEGDRYRVDLSESGRVQLQNICKVFRLVHQGHFVRCLPHPEEWDEQGHVAAAADVLLEAKRLLTGLSRDEARSVFAPEVPEDARYASRIERDLECSWTLRINDRQRDVIEAATRLHWGASVGDFHEIARLGVAPKPGYSPDDEAVSQARITLERAGSELVAWRRLRGEDSRTPKDGILTLEIMRALASVRLEQSLRTHPEGSPAMSDDDSRSSGPRM